MPLDKMKKEQAARVAAVRSQEAARSREAVQKRRPPSAPTAQKVASIFSVYTVLTTIAKILPIKNLLKLRVTSTDWNTIFSEELVKRSTRFRLMQSDPVSFSRRKQEYKDYRKNGEAKGIWAKYVTTHGVSLNHEQPNELERIKHELFAVPFNNLEELDFDMGWSEFKPNPTIPPLTMIHPLPSVRKLKVDLYCEWAEYSMDTYQLAEPIQQFIEELVMSCTCLQVLVLPTDFTSSTCRILRCLSSTLTELHLSGFYKIVYASTVSELIQAGLHLTTFHVSFVGGNCGFGSAYQDEADFQQMLSLLSIFLSSQAGSLLHLKLKTWSHFGEFKLCLPPLPQLQSLKLKPDTSCRNCEGCRSPTLVLHQGSLDLNYQNITGPTKLKNSANQHFLRPECLPLEFYPAVKFRLSLSASTLSACRHFTHYIPFLTSLKLWFWVRRSMFHLIIGECIELVCTSWPLLEELDFTLDTPPRNMDVEGPEPNIDELLTGVSKEFHTKPPAELVKSRPGIGDLRYLRKFIMRKEGEYGGKVSDVTGYHCFANPKSRLQQIRINNSAISAECEDAIRVNLGMACVLELSNSKYN